MKKKQIKSILFLHFQFQNFVSLINRVMLMHGIVWCLNMMNNVLISEDINQHNVLCLLQKEVQETKS